MAFLELKDIRKAYYLDKQKFPVLKGIDLSFERGEFVSILGESGGGKSTLMKMMTGLLKPSSGDVFIKDINTFYGEYQAGADTESRAPLTDFTFEDVEPGIVNERGGGR